MLKVPAMVAFSATLMSEPATPAPSLGMVTLGGPALTSTMVPTPKLSKITEPTEALVSETLKASLNS